ncbi:MAG TPA: Asp-tRNA(Asn)/Glu-tRNA(Gln) amidotransferase subunit GatC [Candidatus Paceibacterota bacterium]|jgi:aspartyl/glutamyl-tRNA(Asn/Gln) amidotransferase C subunit
MDKTEVGKLANLARLELSLEEAESLAQEIESILGYISEIKDVATDTKGCEVTAHRNIVREDGIPHESGIHTEAILGNVPNRERDFIKVKRIIQHE